VVFTAIQPKLEAVQKGCDELHEVHNGRDKSILVIGIGNEYRSDDGVGLVVARRLKERVPSRVSVREESGEAAALMETWREADVVILIDAVCSGADPGTVHRLDAHEGPIPGRFFQTSTHAFGVAEAIEMARTLGQLPPRLILFGIEGKSFEAGVGLSPEVDKVVPRVMELVQRCLGLDSESIPGKARRRANPTTES
jgi:hydrogenase maturation protease